jgi:hypothetical protein
LRALTGNQFAVLGSAAMAQIQTDVIRGIDAADIAQLRTDTIRGLHSDQLLALSTAQVAALSVNQMGALLPNGPASGQFTTAQMVAFFAQLRADYRHDRGTQQP